MRVEFRAISKRFGGVAALQDVSFEVRSGERHAIVGENGAGKSTLGKILAGIYRPDRGALLIDGANVRFGSPRDAALAGVGMVHQELAFCPNLSVAENLAIGRYPRGRLGLLDRRRMRENARAALEAVELTIDVERPMRSLSVAQEQLAQIAAALQTGARLIIFDEPTSSLSELDADRLFARLKVLRRQGVTTIYVSHRMPEILRLADRITVLRDGRLVETLDRRDADEARLVRLMVGRTIEAASPAAPRPYGPEVLRADGLSSPGRFRDIRLRAQAGEIVGLAGLIGAGRSEVAAALFGLDRRAEGKVEIGGEPRLVRSPREAMNAQVGLVPEDRKRQGLALGLSGRRNLSLTALDRLSRLGFVPPRREKKLTRSAFERWGIKASAIDAPVGALSGGNQQKIVLAKWFIREPRLLIADEPTRGVDVAAKQAIHARLEALAAQGAGILLISSELPELIRLAHRIVVMREGEIVGEVSREDATQDRLMALMAGVKGGGATGAHPRAD